MTESIYQIPGTTPEHGESLDAPQQHLDDARAIALRAVREALGTEYKPSPETLEHTRRIGTVTRLHVAHRSSIASDTSKAA